MSLVESRCVLICVWLWDDALLGEHALPAALRAFDARPVVVKRVCAFLIVESNSSTYRRAAYALICGAEEQIIEPEQKEAYGNNRNEGESQPCRLTIVGVIFL